MQRYYLLLIAASACGKVANGASEDLPEITSVSPDRGPANGGIMVTISGTNLDGGTPTVLVGNAAATDVSATSGTSVTFTLPPGAEGDVVDVTIGNDNGFATNAQAFTYNFQPQILAISPPIGKAAGGTAITITGRGFQDAGTPTITIAGGEATSVTVVDDRTITATTGAVAAATAAFTPLDVEVENDNGKGTLAAAFKVTKQGLLVSDRQNPSSLFHVDTTTGAVAKISSLTEHISACALNAGTNTLFAKAGNRPTHKLVTFDPLTGVVTTIGNLTEGGQARAIGSMTFNGNTLIGYAGGCSAPECNFINRLVTINTSTGAVTTIGATPIAMPAGQGAAIAPLNAANVFFATRLESSLDTVATATSVKTTGLAFSGGNPQNQPVTNMVNIAGTLFILERANPGGVIYKVDPATAVLVKLGELSTPNLASAMCQTPATF